LHRDLRLAELACDPGMVATMVCELGPKWTLHLLRVLEVKVHALARKWMNLIADFGTWPIPKHQSLYASRHRNKKSDSVGQGQSVTLSY
jgi:hypothetical protein